MAELRRLIRALQEAEEVRKRRLWWSHFRRAHQEGAKRCHFKQRACQAPLSRPIGKLSPIELSGVIQLSDVQWEQIQPLLPKYVSVRRSNPSDQRQVVEGILWVVGTGAGWRQLPACFGPWSRAAEHSYRWCKDGRWARILQVLQQQDVPISSSV